MPGEFIVIVAEGYRGPRMDEKFLIFKVINYNKQFVL